MTNKRRGATSRRNPNVLTNHKRQELAFQRFLSGMSYDQIARSPHPEDPDKPLYFNKGSAYNAVQDARKRHAGETNTREMIDLEAARYLRLLQAVWGKGIKGDLWAVDRCLTIMNQYEDLLGLKAPKRATVEVITESAVDAEIARLSEQLAAEAMVTDADIDAAFADAE